MTEDTKVCSKCGEEKKIIYFYKHPSNKDRLKSICKSCCSKHHKKYLLTDIGKSSRSLSWKRYNEKCSNEKKILTSAKCRAKQKGIDFNLTIEDIVIPDVCPVLGIPILKNNKEKRCDASPTLDRIDNTKGYVKGNVYVISYRANALKNNGSAEEHRKIAEYMERMTHLTESQKR